MNRAVRVIGWLGFACSVAAILALGAVLVTHPRNNQNYLNYIAGYGPRAVAVDSEGHIYGRPDVTASSSTLVAAGDRACAWLDRQPVALWRTGDSWRFPALLSRYKHAMSDADAELPDDIISGAWAYLCPGSLYLHKPHYVFNSPGD